MHPIGGIEEFFYQIAKIYHNKYDITIYCLNGDKKQLDRLRQYVRVRKYKQGEIIKCDKAFFNYYATLKDKVEAKEKYLIIHADYLELAKKNLIDLNKIPKPDEITDYIGVSQLVCDNFEKITGIKPKLIYNPFEVDKPKKLITLISTTRLDDEKGLDNMEILIKKLDNYCLKNNCDYMWYVYTNQRPTTFLHDKVVFVEPRLDVESNIKKADYLVQLSKHEAFCYAVVKSLCLGTPCIVTDLPVFKEIGVNNSNSIILDMNNITDEQIDNIFNKDFNFTYTPPKSKWSDILAKGKSSYKYEAEKEREYIVEALQTYKLLRLEDSSLGRIPERGERFKVTEDRLETLLGDNSYGYVFVKLIEEIRPDNE